MAERLRLYAASAEDLEVISALVQDAAMVAGEAGFDPAGRRMVLMLNRYRWERKSRSRIRAALRFDGVSKVQRRDWPPGADTVLNLLAVDIDDGRLHIRFSGGTSIRSDIEAIDVELHDISGPWGTRNKPRHR